MNDQIIDIEIPNFRKYNPRKDYKTMPWVRIETNIFFDEVFFSCDPRAKALWFFFVTYVAGKGSERCRMDATFVSKCVGLRLNMVRKFVDDLEQKQLLIVHSRSWDVGETNAIRSLRNVTERNETDGTERKEKTRPEPVKPPPPKPAIKPNDFPDLVKRWNEVCSHLGEVRAFGPKRQDLLKARLKEFPDESVWHDIFDRVGKSKFCQGQSQGGWKLTFPWLIKTSENFYKALEGNYDDRPHGRNRTREENVSQANQELFNEFSNTPEERIVHETRANNNSTS